MSGDPQLRITGSGMRKLLKQNRPTKSHMFQVGDEVKVRSGEEILRTLNSADRLDGCLLMEQMWDYCGLRFRVLKAAVTLLINTDIRCSRPVPPYVFWMV